MDIILYFFLLTIPLSIAASIYAGRLHRSRFGWWLISMILSPIVSFAFLIALGASPADEEDNDAECPCPRCNPGVASMARRL